MELSRPFQVTVRQKELEIHPRKVGGDWVYIVRFPDGNPPLMVTRAQKEKGGHFWTSIPEGRQSEAEMIGPEITAYYQSQVTA